MGQRRGSRYVGLQLDRDSLGLIEKHGFPSSRENPTFASNQQLKIAESGPSPPQFFLPIPEENEHLQDLPFGGAPPEVSGGGHFGTEHIYCLCV